jgi:hypothetical protein
MPYKEGNKLRKKIPNRVSRPKPQYKVTNWSIYNKSLKKRGQLSLLFPSGDLQDILINENSYCKGHVGRYAFYQPAYVELIYIHYRLFAWGMRQISGYFEDLWKTKGLDIPVPSFGSLSDLFGSISLEVKQFCEKVKKRIENGEAVDLIADSSGMSFSKASGWYENKYDKPCKKRPWKKMHLSMDPQMNIHAIQMTTDRVDDRDVLDDLIPDGLNIDKFIADGGYYSMEISESLLYKGIMPIIPPPSDAVVHGHEWTKWHDKIVQYIKDKGTVYAFHKKYGYGIRSLVEALFSRIKRCLGSTLLTQRDSSQKNEGIIIANIINRWNSFGTCNSQKIG